MANDEEGGDVCANGIDGQTGSYLEPRPSADELFEHLTPRRPEELRQQALADAADWSALRGDPADLAQVGWGLVLLEPVGDRDGEAVVRVRNAKIQEALAPLLRRRASEAGERYRVMYARRSESRESFLARHGQGFGAPDPRIVPYYYLIVADPDAISFAFQCSLDAQSAVGRLWFDAPHCESALASYASAVSVAASIEPRQRHVDFIGIANDPATRSSSEDLVQPLHDDLDATGAAWTKRAWIGPQASRERLLERFAGPATPGLVFAAAHGVSYPKDDPRQETTQGALVCQEWPGEGAPAPEHLIAASNIPPTADLGGAVFFLFACFGLGTPRDSDFVHLDRRQRTLELASRARIAPLAQRLLERGALAVIGHVERAWSWSYQSKALRELSHFDAALTDIIGGARLGTALEAFGQRYADAATVLSRELEDRLTTVPQPKRIARLWTIVNDARGYALFGDPAVRFSRAQ